MAYCTDCEKILDTHENQCPYCYSYETAYEPDEISEELLQYEDVMDEMTLEEFSEMMNPSNWL